MSNIIVYRRILSDGSIGSKMFHECRGDDILYIDRHIHGNINILTIDDVDINKIDVKRIVAGHIVDGHYYDKNGDEIKEGDNIKYDSERVEKVYMTNEGELGIDATNPKWIESGVASPCEYGVYPLYKSDLAEVVKI